MLFNVTYNERCRGWKWRRAGQIDCLPLCLQAATFEVDNTVMSRFVVGGKREVGRYQGVAEVTRLDYADVNQLLPFCSLFNVSRFSYPVLARAL